MSAGMKRICLPIFLAAVNSSLATSPPPIATIRSLLSTIAVEVGESRLVWGSTPPEVASFTKNTMSTHGDSLTLFFWACVETIPAVENPLRWAIS